MPISFVIPGPPQAWQRPGTSADGRRYTEQATREFERRVKQLAWVAGLDAGVSEPHDGPVLLRVRAFAPPLKGEHEARLKGTRPDWDNLGKGVSDALNGTLYVDDGQVAVGSVEKWYAARGSEPRTEVLVKPLGEVRCCATCGVMS